MIVSTCMVLAVHGFWELSEQAETTSVRATQAALHNVLMFKKKVLLKMPTILQGFLFAFVGACAGLTGTAISNILLLLRQKLDPSFQTQNEPPNVPLNAATWAAHMGISSNVRYQVLNGLDMVSAVRPACAQLVSCCMCLPLACCLSVHWCHQSPLCYVRDMSASMPVGVLMAETGESSCTGDPKHTV